MTVSFAVLSMALFAALPAWSQAVRCESVMLAESLGQEKAFDRMMEELVRFQQELSTMTEARERAGAVLAFRQKYQDLEKIAGRSIREEFLNRLQKNSETPPSESKTAAQKAKSQRKNLILPDNAPLHEILREDLGTLVGTSYTFDRSIHWSASERFAVILKDNGTSVFDSQTQTLKDGSLGEGHFYSKKDLWLENERDSVTLRDLETGKVFGPLEGWMSSRFQSPNFIVLQRDLQNSVLHRLADGFEIPLGKSFTISENIGSLVRFDGNEKMEFVDLATGHVLKTMEGTEVEGSFPHPDFLSFKVGSQHKLLRSSDQRIFNLSTGAEPRILSPNGRFVLVSVKIWKSRSGSSVYSVLDLETGRESESVSGVNTSYDVTSDSGFFLISRRGSQDESTDFISTKDLSVRRVEARLEKFSENGRWAYTQNRNEAYDLEKQSAVLNFGQDFTTFVGSAQLAILRHQANGSMVQGYFPGGQSFRYFLGDGGATASPTGRFLIAEDNGEVVIFERRAGDDE